ncbi:hypothetical protein PFISCL1PPCAC_11081, partial [Pristionchus fissidentatus]
QAFILSSTEKLGTLVTRAIELMQAAVKSDDNSKKLNYLLKSLEMERKLTLKHDKESNSLLRDLAYSFCEGLTRTIESIMEDKNVEVASA